MTLVIGMTDGQSGKGEGEIRKGEGWNHNCENISHCYPEDTNAKLNESVRLEVSVQL